MSAMDTLIQLAIGWLPKKYAWLGPAAKLIAAHEDEVKLLVDEGSTALQAAKEASPELFETLKKIAKEAIDAGLLDTNHAEATDLIANHMYDQDALTDDERRIMDRASAAGSGGS